ncbi:hypothetical protein QJQ45_005384 [Haematococcus lacustris]|nr:hypothetical protein QJQ45_005384 [Haematococcus lacustris]
MPIARAKVFRLARNFRGRARNVWSIARQRVEKALQHSFRGRKEKKRTFRSLFIARINAGAREHGLPYSHLMKGLNDSNIMLNRNVLSELAMTEPFSFKALCDQVKLMRGTLAN